MRHYATITPTSQTAKMASRTAAAARTAAQVRGASATHPLLRLQQAYGNRFVQQWVRSQRAARAGGGPGLQQDIQRARGGGQPLPGHVRAPMEQALAADFSHVRLHTDGEADRLSRGLSAQAFTTGQDIFLRRSQAGWASAAGRELIAHELTHVVQQRAVTPGAAPALGRPHDHHEREADSTARAVAAGHQVDAAALTPATAPVVQRRYLDEGKDAGYKNWLDDTTVKKGLVVASREKLTYVDMLLAQVLAQHGTPAWFTPGWEDLEALDKALTALKYETSTKTSAAFTRRQQAVRVLRREIVVRRQSSARLFEATHDPKVADLMGVGFVESYLDELAPGDLDLLHQAHQALSQSNLIQAQALFDQLNPPMPPIPTVVSPQQTALWAPESYTTINQIQGKGNLFDFERIRDDTMAAQRQLLAFHAHTIGGDYSELFRYKPYKQTKLTDLRGANYFNGQSLRSWNTVEQGGYGGMAPTLIAAATTRADQIAEQSTQASRARGKNKPDKAALTPSETAALRVYTSDDYREMNAVLRDYRIDQPTANWDKYSAIAKLAISGLGKLPKARGVISYRGDRDTAFGGHEGVLRQGATFRLPNFYSTTNNAGRAFPGQAGYIFFNDRYGRLIDRISTLPEGEVLLPPGATYKIVAQYDRHDQNSPWASPDGKGLSEAARKFQATDQYPLGRRRILEFVEA
jgi:hypothetical protein